MLVQQNISYLGCGFCHFSVRWTQGVEISKLSKRFQIFATFAKKSTFVTWPTHFRPIYVHSLRPILGWCRGWTRLMAGVTLGHWFLTRANGHCQLKPDTDSALAVNWRLGPRDLCPSRRGPWCGAPFCPAGMPGTDLPMVGLRRFGAIGNGCVGSYLWREWWSA